MTQIYFMKKIIQKLFTENKINILLVLLLSTIFCLSLIRFRMYYASASTYRFLVWNLFLAWVPYGISLCLILFKHEIKSEFSWGLGILIWLLFFPNAPYIVTDLFHLYPKPPVPIWYDLILIFSFAWTGILLGFLSLWDVQRFLGQKIGDTWAIAFSLLSLGLGGFGIYLGRYLRWNSWDVLTHPHLLALDILDRLIYPLQHPRMLAITVLFSAFLLIVYLTFWVLLQDFERQKDN